MVFLCRCVIKGKVFPP